ncbi:MAG: hypothetical protein J6V00_05275 [Bacteroidaceae bacterium]|nr:hypothetical protein [Bacteroidaceae bacterium]
MCLRISGSPTLSLKSKAEALKYAIEFTSTGEYPNHQYNMRRAKELFDFICENVKLPDVEVDQLSNSLSGFTSLMEKLSKKDEETQDKKMEIAGEGEGPVKEDVRRPCSTELWNQYLRIEAYIKSLGLKPYRGEASPDYTKQTFLLEGINECLWVTLEHNAYPLPNTK